MVKTKLRTILICCLSVTGCATLTMPPNVPVDNVSKYNLSVEKEGLAIAVDPFFEKDRLKRFFDTDLLDNGILPIMIVVENNSKNDGYILDKNSFSIAMKSQPTSDSEKTTDPSISLNRKEIDALNYSAIGLIGTSLIIGPPILLVPGLIADFYAGKKYVDNRKINDNLLKKAFIDKTVYPNDSHSGFVYFKLKDRDDIQNICELLVVPIKISSDEKVIFEFRIKK
jgi:hypothetical protein